MKANSCWVKLGRPDQTQPEPEEWMITGNENEFLSNKDASPGDRMPDGTIFVGISPKTQQPMYATPADAPLRMTWEEAMKYAARLDAHGHRDWRVPTKAELNLLWENRD